MKVSIDTRQAYAEIDNFIELLDEYDRNKIPKKLREFFKREKDNNYTKQIDFNRPIKKQNLKKETITLIALLNLKYICEDEKEKEILQKIYQKNEEKYQEELRQKYDEDNIFKNRMKENDKKDVTEQLAMVEYKESFFKKVLNKINALIKH